MKIHPISDLHLDVSPANPVLPGGDVLLLAGDVAEARSFKPNGTPTNDRCRAFFETEVPKYQKTFMVMGNHEHYHENYDKTLVKLRHYLPPSVTILENETAEYEGVLFIGATFWTDMNRCDPLTLHAMESMMTDFRLIRWGDDWRRFTPKSSVHKHERSVQYIKHVLGNPGNEGKPVVVMTHHAPSFASVGEEYRGDYIGNGAYASKEEDLILDYPQIKLWVHGHMHSDSDYMIGETRVICNPRGYISRNGIEKPYWNSGLTIEL